MKLYDSYAFGMIVGNCKVVGKLRFLQYPTSSYVRGTGSLDKKMLFHMDYIFSYLSSASLAMFWDMFVAHRTFFADNPLIGEH